MKLYNKIVEKLSMHMDKMVVHSVFTFNLMITLYKLSLTLLKWGRIATLISFVYAMIAIEFLILSVPSKRGSSFDILTHEQSYILLISALLLWTIVLILRFTSLLIKDATEMWEKKMEKKLNSK